MICIINRHHFQLKGTSPLSGHLPLQYLWYSAAADDVDLESRVASPALVAYHIIKYAAYILFLRRSNKAEMLGGLAVLVMGVE